MTKSQFDDYGGEDAFWKHQLVHEWQSRTDSVLNELNNNNDRVYELYIVSSDKFQRAVVETRKELGIKITKSFDINDANSWADKNIDINKIPSSTSPLHYFYKTINAAIDEIELPRTWRNIFAYYVVTDDKPGLSRITSMRKLALVKDIDDDSITIRLSKGIRYEEYVKLWQIVTQYLGPGRRKAKTPDENIRIRDLQMYIKRQRGYKNREIAKEYFSTDITSATDAVKKAVKRQKKLFDKGIDLAD